MQHDKSKSNDKRISVRALKVNQWLEQWEKVKFDSKNHRRAPAKFFYIFSLSARQLRSLSGVNRRDVSKGKERSSDKGIQRAHQESRSKNIAQYIKFGFPWSDLSQSQRAESKFDSLRKPGWLPTAIVVNILTGSDRRGDGESVDPADLITISQGTDGISELHLPLTRKTQFWKPKQRHPIEVIDGQHRLLAFDESLDEDYELPVVAFYGLDISWQAYLFWTINIKPKRINPSLAYDLYPLLRTEDWLEHFEGHKVYREARAQELVEILWSEPQSPWHQRINMLGESGGASVTQSAWVRALLKSFVKSFEGRGISIGGLFGAPVGQDQISLPWNRNQQAALLILIWSEIRDAVKGTDAVWACELRDVVKQRYSKEIDGDEAFCGPCTLLNNDQGVTVVLNVFNDLLFANQENLELKSWNFDIEGSPAIALKELKKRKKIASFVTRIAKSFAGFDWRSSAAIGLTELERTSKLSYRGGSGYREFRRLLLVYLTKQQHLGQIAKEVHNRLGF